jgi:hypothetical protein
VETFAECLSLFAFKYDQAMRNTILVEEIVQLMSKSLIPLRYDTHSSEFAVPNDLPASHNHCIDDRFANIGNLGQGAPEFSCGHVEYLSLFRGYPR